jgi:two-component system cell cycle response regulator
MSAQSTTVNVHPLVLLGCSAAATVEAMTSLLESWLYRVNVVGSGVEALAAVQAVEPPSVALLDMDLPAPGAAEIVRALRARQEASGMQARRTWVILLSGRPDKDRLRTALACGCDDFLVIPPAAPDLRLRIRIAERVLALTCQLQQQSAEVRYHSTHDGLTGLWNREALLNLIFQETDRVQRMKTGLSLLLLDLDDFSRINHDYGYEAGDRVLTDLANRFRRQLRSYDLIGRYGEDEFLLGLPGCDLDNAHLLARRVGETILAHPFALGQDAITLTGSFGIAVSHGRSPLVVLREAERALAEAKLAGKNCARGYTPLSSAELDLSAGISGRELPLPNFH